MSENNGKIQCDECGELTALVIETDDHHKICPDCDATVPCQLCEAPVPHGDGCESMSGIFCSAECADESDVQWERDMRLVGSLAGAAACGWI